jgi:hypothetical protein
MSDQNFGTCKRCEEKNMILTTHLGEDLNGLCNLCYELDSTPTSKECDNGCGIATFSVGSYNFCEDCYENYCDGYDID